MSFKVWIISDSKKEILKQLKQIIIYFEFQTEWFEFRIQIEFVNRIDRILNLIIRIWNGLLKITNEILEFSIIGISIAKGMYRISKK